MSRTTNTHLVPQMMIRRFAGADGKLLELIKPQLNIATRRRHPKGILFSENYYRDFVADLDNDLLKPIEQKFARFYPLIADEAKPTPPPPEGGSAFIEWVSAMLIRTQSFISFWRAMADKTEGGSETLLVNMFPKEMQNVARTVGFNHYVDLLSRQDFVWKVITFPSNACIVLTDNPVCQTNGLGSGGQVTIVPISKHRVMLGGHKKGINELDHLATCELNFFLAGWAESRIYAADKPTLVSVVETLTAESSHAAEASRPFFGSLKRLAVCEKRPRVHRPMVGTAFGILRCIPHSQIMTKQLWQGVA